MKHLTPILYILLFSCLNANAGERVTSMLDSLVSRGNRAYELSQRSRIKIYADSLAMLLDGADLSEAAFNDYAVSLYKLYGNYHYENGTLDSALIYYGSAKKIIEDNPHNDFHGNDLLMLRELAQLYYRQKSYEKAAETMAQADDLMEYNGSYLLGDDNWLTAKLTYAMCLARMKHFDKALKIAETELENAIDKNGLAYAKAQRMYGKIRLLANADRAGALTAYKDYFRKQKEYSTANFSAMTAPEREEYWQTLQPFVADCYQLENADPAFLYDVTLFAKGLLLQLSRLSGEGKATEDALKSLGYRWTDIQRKLGPGQAAIEFIQYDKDGASKMAALLLKNSGLPQFVALTSPDEILSVAGEDIGSTDRRRKDALYGNEQLQRLIWTDGLLNALSGVRKLYFAPDGYLHRLAIEYMPQVHDMALYRLTSTRRLMEHDAPFAQTAPMLLFGGINYDLDRATGTKTDNDSTAYGYYRGKRFPRLSTASNETIEVYRQRNNKDDSLVTSALASEYSFRELAGSYGSILVSTHGDFCGNDPVPTDIKPVRAGASMSNSIIALAGVNTHLHDAAFDSANSCDGLLSAGELAKLDLSECRLFTLSACQTALGEISPDGVFGLQRGLKNAGVGAMILSLWNVNSEATATLMRKFYALLSDGMAIKEAFETARRELSGSRTDDGDRYEFVFDPATMSSVKVKARNSTSYASPQFVNAFIVIDAIE